MDGHKRGERLYQLRASPVNYAQQQQQQKIKIPPTPEPAASEYLPPQIYYAGYYRGLLGLSECARGPFITIVFTCPLKSNEAVSPYITAAP